LSNIHKHERMVQRIWCGHLTIIPVRRQNIEIAVIIACFRIHSNSASTALFPFRGI
jgi:hypothetical protein